MSKRTASANGALREAYSVRVTTKDFDVEIKATGDGWMRIDGSAEDLKTVTNTIVLAGAEEDSGVAPDNGGLRVREGTVALWLSFEVLNYLEFE